MMSLCSMFIGEVKRDFFLLHTALSHIIGSN